MSKYELEYTVVVRDANGDVEDKVPFETLAEAKTEMKRLQREDRANARIEHLAHWILS